MLDYRPMIASSGADAAALFSLLQQALGFSLVVHGRLPNLEDATEAISEVPPGKDMKDKFFGGYWQNGVLVGCMDLIRGYPEPDIAYLGLLVFSEARQGQGLGVLALAHIANLSRSWGCTALRLAVVDRNARALAFWQREGFRELYRKPGTQYAGHAIVMERAL